MNVFSSPRRLSRDSTGPRAQLAPVAAWMVTILICVRIAVEGGHAGVVAGVALVVLAAFPTVARLRRDTLDGPGLYGLVTAVFFGLVSLQWLGTPPAPAPGIGPDDVSRALILVACGLLAFTIGVHVTGPAAVRPPLQYTDDDAQRRLRLIVALFVLGAAGTGVGIASGTVGYTADAGSGWWRTFSQAFVQLASLGALAVLACSFQAFGAQDRRAKRLLPLLIAGQLVIGFAAGFKGAALMPLVFAGLAFVACSGRIPWRPILAATAIALAVIIPANIVYRSVLRPTPGATQDHSVGALAADAQRLVLLRYRLIDHVALIEARTPETYPYAQGRRYAELPALVLVPRFLWPDKPLLDDALAFSHTYWEIPRRIKTSTPLTQPGDLARNFGALGVAIGLAIWGAVVGLFTKLCMTHRTPRVEMVYVASLVGWITVVESDLPQLVAAASRSVPVAVIVAWLLLPGGTSPGRLSRLLPSVAARIRPRRFTARDATGSASRT